MTATPAAPAVPLSQIRPGVTIGQWTVRRDDRISHGRQAVEIACVTCGRTRISIRLTFAAGHVRSCAHGEKNPRTWATPARDATLAWITAHTAGHPVTAADVAKGLGITREIAVMRILTLVSDGRLARYWSGAYAPPGAGPYERPAPATGTDPILRFLAADGGGTRAEIRAATGLDASLLTSRLAALAGRGEIIRLDGGPRAAFYVLPGQQPGEVLDPSSAPAGAAC